MMKTKIALVALTLAVASGPANAYTTVNNLNHRPVGAIAADLGIEPLEFEACFAQVTPAPPGTQPTREREQANKAILLPCLQAANNTITNSLLDEVMNRYRGVYVDQPY